MGGDLPENSVLCWLQENSWIFVYPAFSCCQDRNDNFQAWPKMLISYLNLYILIFLNFLYVCSVVSVMSDSLWPHGLQPTRLLCPWWFSRQEYWSGLPCPPPWDLPDPGMETRLQCACKPHCRWVLYQLSHQGSLYNPLLLLYKSILLESFAEYTK